MAGSRYYTGPTWEGADGSKVTGKQVAVAPASAGNLPLQLVNAEPAMGSGAMTGVTYSQRSEHKGRRGPSDGLRRGWQRQASDGGVRG